MLKNVLAKVANRSRITTNAVDLINMLDQRHNIRIGNSVLAVQRSVVVGKLHKWHHYMPNITPYYAIKSFPDNEICRLFNNFDCASFGEISRVLSLNKQPSNIIYANPNKRRADLIKAIESGIKMVTADNHDECQKILDISQDCKIVLRLSVPDDGARNTKFSGKFGINNFIYGTQLIDYLYSKNPAALMGFSFHAGSGQTHVNAYQNGVNLIDEYITYIKTRHAQYADGIRLIDIGGGFTSQTDLCAIYDTLQYYMTKYQGIQWIAEPGRYFSEDAAILFTPIIGKNKRNGKTNYIIADSVYHSFSCKMYDAADPFNNCIIEPSITNNVPLTYGPCSVMGDTCDGIDVIQECINMPNDLPIGTILVFPKMGAYVKSSSSNFNGFEPPIVCYLD